MSLESYRSAMQRSANTLRPKPTQDEHEPATLIRIISYGCKEYLRRRGFITEGVLEYIPVAPPVLTVTDIQERVADYYRLPVREMRSARRARVVCRPRQVAMYLSRNLTPRSLPEIGRLFGNRDHTTVIHAIRQIERLRAGDPELDRDVKRLTRELEAA